MEKEHMTFVIKGRRQKNWQNLEKTGTENTQNDMKHMLS